LPDLEKNMDKKEPMRNMPTEEGKRNDPDLRDDSAIQPGVETISNSEYDEENEKLTKTGADDFRTRDDKDPGADKAFDEVDKD
jgi:hypothetical protein